MENQLLIAAFKAKLFVLRARLRALEFQNHDEYSIRVDWNITSYEVNALEVEIERLERES